MWQKTVKPNAQYRRRLSSFLYLVFNLDAPSISMQAMSLTAIVLLPVGHVRESSRLAPMQAWKPTVLGSLHDGTVADLHILIKLMAPVEPSRVLHRERIVSRPPRVSIA